MRRLRRLELAVASLLAPELTKLKSKDLDALARAMVQLAVDASPGESGENGAVLPGTGTPEGQTDSQGSVRNLVTLREKLLAALEAPETKSEEKN